MAIVLTNRRRRAPAASRRRAVAVARSRAVRRPTRRARFDQVEASRDRPGRPARPRPATRLSYSSMMSRRATRDDELDAAGGIGRAARPGHLRLIERERHRLLHLPAHQLLEVLGLAPAPCRTAPATPWPRRPARPARRGRGAPPTARSTRPHRGGDRARDRSMFGVIERRHHQPVGQALGRVRRHRRLAAMLAERHRGDAARRRSRRRPTAAARRTRTAGGRRGRRCRPD